MMLLELLFGNSFGRVQSYGGEGGYRSYGVILL